MVHHIVSFLFVFLSFPILVAAQVEMPTRTVVLLVTPGQLIDSEDAIVAIQSQLDDLKVELQVQRISQTEVEQSSLFELAVVLSRQEGVTTVIWVDRNKLTQFYFLTHRQGGADLFERTIPAHTKISLQIENMALMCRATVRALLAMDMQISLSSPPKKIDDSARPPVADSRPQHPSKHRESLRKPRENTSLSSSKEIVIKPTPTPPEDYVAKWGVNVAYAARFDSSTSSVVHAFRGGIHGRITPLLNMFVSYEVRQPLVVKGSCVDVKVQPHPIGVGGNIQWHLGKFVFGPQLSFMLDYATRKSTVSVACHQVEKLNDTPRYNAAIGVQMSGAYFVHPRVGIFTAIGADFFVLQGSYAAPSAEGKKEVLVHPNPVEAVASMGLMVDII